MNPSTAETTPEVAPSTGRGFAARWLLVSLVVFVVLAVVHRESLFVQPWHEHGDYAVEALTIARAGEFREIHGSFSRFGFKHPGPAFYYVDALGKKVLYDWWHVVPSPHNAHVFAGLLLQCFFFAAALVMASEWIRRPLFLPLALLTAAIHFGFAENVFTSTWQPRVTLIPFFCFVVGAASVAAGAVRHLPWAVLAGCFLVHGHVGQPLYVVPLFVLAYAVVWRRAMSEPGGIRAVVRDNVRAHLVSAGCIAVFLVPLVIDLVAGARGNLAQIVEFWSFDHGPGKPWWKALVYFAGFFGYVKKPEAFLSRFGPDRAAAIGEHLAGYFVWAAIIVVALVFTRRMWLRRSAVERPFVLSLTAFTTLAFLLSLYWGTIQIGSMYEYNGYFFYGILSCALLLFCAAVSKLAVPKPRLVAAFLCMATVVVAWQRQFTPLGIDYSNNVIPPAVAKALAADPLPAATKYLLFNRHDWGEAVSIGLALERLHCDFRADADWGPKFAPDGGFEPVPPDFDLHGLSTWRLSRLGPTEIGSPIRDNLRVYFHPLPLDPANAVIECSENANLELYTLFGFASPVGSSAWTIRPYAGLVFDAPSVASDVSVSILAEPYEAAGRARGQPMTLNVNGQDVYTGVLTERGSIAARVPAAVWNAKQPVLMVLHLPGAVSPHDLGLSMERKMFGWKIERITFSTTR